MHSVLHDPPDALNSQRLVQHLQKANELACQIAKREGFLSASTLLNIPPAWINLDPNQHAHRDWPRVLDESLALTYPHFLAIAEAKLHSAIPPTRYLAKGYVHRLLRAKLTPHLKRFLSMSAFIHVDKNPMELDEFQARLIAKSDGAQWMAAQLSVLPPLDDGQYDRLLVISRLYSVLFTMDDQLAHEQRVNEDSHLALVERLLRFAVDMLTLDGFEQAMAALGHTPLEQELRAILVTIYKDVFDTPAIDPQAAEDWWLQFADQLGRHLAAALKHTHSPAEALATHHQGGPTYLERLLRNDTLSARQKIDAYIRLRELVSGMNVAACLEQYFRLNFFSYAALQHKPSLPPSAVALVQELEVITSDFGGLLNDVFSFWKELYQEQSIMNWVTVSVIAVAAEARLPIADLDGLATLLRDILADSLQHLADCRQRAETIVFEALPIALRGYERHPLTPQLVLHASALWGHILKNSYVWQVSQGYHRYQHRQALANEMRPEWAHTAGDWFNRE